MAKKKRAKKKAPSIEKLMKKAEEDAEKLNKERDERCIPLAIKLMEIMGEHTKHQIGDVDREALNKAYVPIAFKMLQVYLDNNIKVQDANHINKIVLQAFDTVNTLIVDTVNTHMRTAQTKQFGCLLTELPFQQLDEILKDDIVE